MSHSTPANPLTPDQIRAAIATLEAQRALLGEAVIEPALYALHQQLAVLDAPPIKPPQDRRLITILFSDVLGSVTLAEQLDPEDWRQIITQVQAAIGNVVVEQRGVIAQYQGDALIALFGSRDISEDDAERAVRAGLAAQEAVARLRLPVPAQIRVGVHTGLVVLGEWGVDARIEFAAFGDAVNVAARLQTSAPPGGVLISHDTYRYVRGIFDVAAQPPVILKGRREPTQTYVVLRARPRPFHTVSRGISGLETRTIGREAEMTQLKQAYLYAYEQRRAIWAQLIGEAGIGKSRLMADLNDWLELRPETARYFRARAFSGDAYQPFALIRRLWFDRFHITEDEPLAQAEAKWIQGFQELAQTAAIEPAQALGLLVGLSFKDSPYLGALRDDPAQVKGRAIVVSRSLFNTIRAEMPVFMLLEDLHWADSSSLDYLLRVLLNSGAHANGLFVLATARPEWRPPDELNPPIETSPAVPQTTRRLMTDLDYVQITLTPLSNTASRELTLTLLQNVEAAPEALVQMIVDRSEGVPYYAEELINLLIDRGVIDCAAEPWTLAADRLDTTQLPQTLQQLLLTRLLALPPAQRTCLQRGAILGRNFWEGSLQALDVLEPRATLLPLQTRALVIALRESTLAGEHEWAFYHSLLRDVTYESVLKHDRQKLHRAAGAWLEQEARQAGRLAEFVDRLGTHAEHAGDLEAAADWYLAAGEHARARGAAIEARAFFERTLALINPVDQARRWQALLGLNNVLTRLSDTAALKTNVEGLIALAAELGAAQQAEAHYRRSLYWDAMGNYRQALLDCETALDLTQHTPNLPLEARLLGWRVIYQNRLGDAAGAALTAQAVFERVANVDEAAVSRALNNLAIYYVESGNLSRAVELHREQAALTHRLGDRAGEANALNNLGYDYVCLGMSLEAHDALEEAQRINQLIGARRELFYARLNLGLAYWRGGDLTTARQQLEQATRDLTASEDAFARAVGLSYLALTLAQSGDTAAAISCFSTAHQQLETLGVHGFAVDAQAGLARCYAALGQWDEARASAERVWAAVSEHGAQGLEFAAWAFLTCAEVFEAVGDRSRARAALDAGERELRARANQIGDTHWRAAFLENVPEHRALLARHAQPD